MYYIFLLEKQTVEQRRRIRHYFFLMIVLPFFVEEKKEKSPMNNPSKCFYTIDTQTSERASKTIEKTFFLRRHEWIMDPKKETVSKNHSIIVLQAYISKQNNNNTNKTDFRRDSL